MAKSKLFHEKNPMFWWLAGFLCRYFWVVFIAGEVSMNACLHGSKWASPLHGVGLGVWRVIVGVKPFWHRFDGRNITI
jgi:hypothetical protein